MQTDGVAVEPEPPADAGDGEEGSVAPARPQGTLRQRQIDDGVVAVAPQLRQQGHRRSGTGGDVGGARHGARCRRRSGVAGAGEGPGIVDQARRQHGQRVDAPGGRCVVQERDAGVGTDGGTQGMQRREAQHRVT
ncbi:MAG: hypothetical protein R2690_11650 [Acidimicrobiales bacterium]